MEGHWKFPSGWGISKLKIFKGTYVAELEVPEGWVRFGLKPKKLVWGRGMDIFWNRTTRVLNWVTIHLRMEYWIHYVIVGRNYWHVSVSTSLCISQKGAVKYSQMLWSGNSTSMVCIVVYHGKTALQNILWFSFKGTTSIPSTTGLMIINLPRHKMSCSREHFYLTFN